MSSSSNSGHSFSKREYMSISMRHQGGMDRDWRSGKNHGRIEQKHAVVSKKRYWPLITGILFVICIIVVIIILIISNGNKPDEDPANCAPGMSGTNCDSTSFIGSYIWSDTTQHILADKIYYKKGIAFRVYAPAASAVSVMASSSGSVEQEYVMSKQSNGYWFSNVGGIGVNSEYLYRISRDGKPSQDRLIQNGHFITFFDNRRWKNLEGDLHSFHLVKQTSFPYHSHLRTATNDGEIIYTIHLPSFTNGGLYSTTEAQLEYLKVLGVTTIRIMGLEPHICDGESEINAAYKAKVVYIEAPHPLYGTQKELYNLIKKTKSLGISVITDVDLTGFTTDSNWYDYDGTSSGSDFGCLFDSQGVFSYESRSCSRPDLSVDSVANKLLQNKLKWFTQTLGFNGFWWRGLLCLRLVDGRCAEGKGTDNTAAISFLRSLLQERWRMYGEDTLGKVTVENEQSDVKNIVDSPNNRGLGFDGQVDDSIGNSLVSTIFSEVIDLSKLCSFISSFSTSNPKRIISLASAEENFAFSRLLTRAISIDIKLTTAVKRIMLLQSLFLQTPGILNVFMGDEYFSEQPFQKHPSALDLENAGRYSNGMWMEKGQKFGFWSLTKALLSIRSQMRLHVVYSPEFYFQSNNTRVIAYHMTFEQRKIVTIINTSSSDIDDTGVEIDFPGDISVTWNTIFTTDSKAWYKDLIEYNDPIVLGNCRLQPHSFPICANVTMGAFALRILEAVI